MLYSDIYACYGMQKYDASFLVVKTIEALIILDEHPGKRTLPNSVRFSPFELRDESELELTFFPSHLLDRVWTAYLASQTPIFD